MIASGPVNESHLLNSLPLRATTGGVGDLVAGSTVLARKAKRPGRWVVDEAMRVSPGDSASLVAMDPVGLDVIPAGAGMVLATALPPIVGRRRGRNTEERGNANEQHEPLQEAPQGSAPSTTSPSGPITSCTCFTALRASSASTTAVRLSLIVQSLSGASRNRAIAGPIVGMPAPLRAWPVSTGDLLVTVTLNRGTDATVPELCSARALTRRAHRDMVAPRTESGAARVESPAPWHRA